MALPWKTLIEGGITPKAGERIVFSVEPNFGTEAGFRISAQGHLPARRGSGPRLHLHGRQVLGLRHVRRHGQGRAAEAASGRQPRVRRGDARRRPGHRLDRPVRNEKMEGFAKIELEMPEDGYVSSNIKNAEGRVVRQLLNATFLTRGKQEILWDGLTNMSHLRPGEVVDGRRLHLGGDLPHRHRTAAGRVGRQRRPDPVRLAGRQLGRRSRPAVRRDHGRRSNVPGLGRLGGGRRPWSAPICDGKVKWRHKRGGFGGARHLAAADGVVYVNDNQLHESVLYRLDAKKGEYSYWKGKETAVLPIEPGLAGLDAGAVASSISAGAMACKCATRRRGNCSPRSRSASRAIWRRGRMAASTFSAAANRCCG